MDAEELGHQQVGSSQVFEELDEHLSVLTESCHFFTWPDDDRHRFYGGSLIRDGNQTVVVPGHLLLLCGCGFGLWAQKNSVRPAHFKLIGTHSPR